MPRNPSRKPATRSAFKRSPATKTWAKTKVVSGMIAMRMPARPLSMPC